MANIVINESFDALGDQLTDVAEAKLDELSKQMTETMKTVGTVAILDFLRWAIDNDYIIVEILHKWPDGLESLLEKWNEQNHV